MACKTIFICVLGGPHLPVTEMNSFSEADVRRFLLDQYREPIQAIGLNLEEVTGDFDFLLSGLIDSYGIVEMISAIEKHFEIQVDLAALDAEHVSVLGPLARYIAERGRLDSSIGSSSTGR